MELRSEVEAINEVRYWAIERTEVQHENLESTEEVAVGRRGFGSGDS